MPRAALRNGSSIERVDWAFRQLARVPPLEIPVLTFSGFPLTPTNVPRLVYSCCDADNETDKREYGAPSTSNLASANNDYISTFLKAFHTVKTYLPGP
jgi:hypothetical protein